MRSNETNSPEEPHRVVIGRGENDSHRSRILLASVFAWDLWKATTAALAHLVLKHDGSVPAPPADHPGRTADREEDPERQNAAHRRWGTFWVGCTFTAALAGGFGFLFIYWTGGNNLLLGVALAIFLGGIGTSLVLYSHRLIVPKQATEPREELSSSAEARDAAYGDYCIGAHDASRRGLLAWMGVAVTALASAIVVSLFRSLGTTPANSLFSTVWKRGQRLTTLDGTYVTVDALQQGSTMVVFPENSIGDERAQTVLVRVDETLLRLPRERADWAPMGYLAYSRVCTHAGCSVGLFEKTSDQLMCPCHQSTFDVLRAAQPTGGPADRPLPQLPLYAGADGVLRAGGGFSEPPGPGFWGMP